MQAVTVIQPTLTEEKAEFSEWQHTVELVLILLTNYIPLQHKYDIICRNFLLLLQKFWWMFMLTKESVVYQQKKEQSSSEC